MPWLCGPVSDQGTIAGSRMHQIQWQRPQTYELCACEGARGTNLVVMLWVTELDREEVAGNMGGDNYCRGAGEGGAKGTEKAGQG